ncbi:peptidoglycan editing factor PgeF [Pseudalkalibacillus berkeleyi]|uniref:Purine nucleoside phosphorylase n=1 Tax=Pseudalkalibacillus berkeleyi TaxID=1069813 RepID=A0ABS9GZA3_9BACL|nr:peptidoglycan editing factor PgeF [Pseudalkalibacillus berkeleyi]MCF6137025.1 peptidoglycan editing factor PgeF [Pseudalkalibacillus berkeleyi]
MKHECYYTINEMLRSNRNVVAGISTRHGGVSHQPFHALNLGLHVHDQSSDVIENRNRLANALNTKLNQWVFADQVHGKQISEVKRVDAGKGSNLYHTGIIGTDGLYTKDSNIVLALAYADCVPIYFSAKNLNIVGIVHAGWKGTVSRIAQEMIHTWSKEENIPSDEIEVWIGPSIQQCCYEVDQHVIDHVDDIMEDKVKPYTTTTVTGKYMLNLQELNRQLLIKAGVPSTQIHVTTLCTSCSVNHFFSHRKENGQTGRMLGFIMFNE